MDIRRISDTITEITSGSGAKIRIEPGPLVKEAIATEELLSDAVTASHYFAGTRKEMLGGREVDKVGVDKLGRPIKLGEPMTYIDWKSRERVFYVYRLEEVTVPGSKSGAGGKKKTKADRFVIKGDRPDYESALSFATELLAA